MGEARPFLGNGLKIYLAVLAIGIIIGAVAMGQVVLPALRKAESADFNAMARLTERLDSRNDELYSCLVKNSVDPETC